MLTVASTRLNFCNIVAAIVRIRRGIINPLRTRDSLAGSYGVIEIDAAISPGTLEAILCCLTGA
ncbi:MAG: hypothetical protein CMD99_03280 [Gammaproteobacteria bacterium]|nr:hypothetical protein [Gammaproteobacteria bacterium]